MADVPSPPDLTGRRTIVDRVSLVAMLMIGAFAVYVLHRYLQDLDLGEVRRGLVAVSGQTLGVSGAFAAAGYFALIGYDWSALRYVGRRLPFGTVALASFCSYAIGNTAGFTLFTGGAVRLRLYSRVGLSLGDIGRVTVFCMIAFGFGISVVSALSILTDPHILADLTGVKPWVIVSAGLGILVSILGFLVFCGDGRSVKLTRWRIRFPSAGLVAQQLAISAIDIGFSCSALFILLPNDLGVSFLDILPIFCAALAVGIISHVPGGIGVFEASMLFALSNTIPKEDLVVSLILFRLIYYILPLICAVTFLILNELYSSKDLRLPDRATSISPWRTALGGVALVALVLFLAVHLAGRSPPLPSNSGRAANEGAVDLWDQGH